MANFQYKAGMHSVGQYQMSGIPFVSGSGFPIPVNSGAPHKVSFPRVSTWVIIENTGTKDLRVAFSENGARSVAVSGYLQSQHFTIPAPNLVADSGSVSPLSRIRLDLRVKDIFLLSDDGSTTGTAQIIAGLTTISTSSVIDFDNWSGSLGVG